VPSAAQFPAVEAAINERRLGRYMAAAGKDKKLAFRYYLWNCQLCEAFLLPLHFAEIVCRNAIHSALVYRYGDDWYTNTKFRNWMASPRFRKELDSAVSDETAQHGSALSAHHIVSALHFG